jgi:hypothetical protein
MEASKLRLESVSKSGMSNLGRCVDYLVSILSLECVYSHHPAVSR